MPANTKQPPASWAAVDSKKGTGGGIDSPWSAPKSKPKSWLSKLMGGKDKSTKDQKYAGPKGKAQVSGGAMHTDLSLSYRHTRTL